MDKNLDGKYKAYDSSRRKEAADEHRLSEVKAKLSYSAERALRSHLAKVAGAKILSTTVDNLNIKEDEESGTALFDGMAIAEVSFYDGKQEKRATITVNIKDSQPQIVVADLKKSLAEASLVKETPATFTATSVTASLSDFKLVDDGTRYLKVYHTAAYGDLEPIGAVSKEEYVQSVDKKSLLSEMLTDEAIAWPADVTFTGEFVEPAIVEKVATEDIQYVVHADESISKVEEAVEDNAYMYKVADSDRLAREAAAKMMNDLRDRISQRALSAFTDAWKAPGGGRGTCTVKNHTSTWEAASGVGEIKIEAEVLDGKDTKLVPFVVSVNGTSMKLPDFSNLASLLKEAKVVPTETIGVNLTQNVAIEKKATPMAPTKTNYQEVLRIPKDFLPASLKVGDVIACDGLRYKSTSKSEGQLSNQRDTASHWLFERVHGDEKPIYRQESY